MYRSTMSTIYVQHEGEKWGPFTTEELEGKVVEGVFSREDLFWTEGMEEWHRLDEVLEVEEEEGDSGEASEEAVETGHSGILEIEETNILFDAPEARLTSRLLHLPGEDLPVKVLAKAFVQSEKIHRVKPIIGSVVLGVLIVCVALIEVHRPNMTAWIIWGAILLGLVVWFLRVLSVAVRSGSTMVIVDLRNGDERMIQLEPGPAQELAAAIDQAIIDEAAR